MLPTPHNWPDTDVVIYDGQCSFCTKQVTKLHRWDGKNRLSFISLHDDFVAEHYPDLSHDEMMQAMYLVDQKGRRHRGLPLRVISRRLPRLWPLALHIPPTLPLWQWAIDKLPDEDIASAVTMDLANCILTTPDNVRTATPALKQSTQQHF